MLKIIKKIFRKKNKINYDKLPVGLNSMVEVVNYFDGKNQKYKLIVNSLNEWTIQIGTMKKTKKAEDNTNE